MKTIAFTLEKNYSRQLEQIKISNEFSMLDAFEIWEQSKGINSVIAPNYLYKINTHDTIPITMDNIKKVFNTLNYKGTYRKATEDIWDNYTTLINNPKIKLEQRKIK